MDELQKAFFAGNKEELAKQLLRKELSLAEQLLTKGGDKLLKSMRERLALQKECDKVFYAAQARRGRGKKL